MWATDVFPKLSGSGGVPGRRLTRYPWSIPPCLVLAAWVRLAWVMAPGLWVGAGVKAVVAWGAEPCGADHGPRDQLTSDGIEPFCPLLTQLAQF